MNSDKQRAAIAEYCGWKFDKNAYKQWISPNGTSWNYPPAYDTDLNSMHEAEESQWNNPKFRLIFTAMLSGLFNHNEVDAYHAPAAKRAEAFLKAIGKWEE